MNGYIKLYRSTLDWEWFCDAKTLSVFVYCLLSANHIQKKWRGHIIEAGQFITSLQSIQKATHLTQRSIRTALNNLKTTGELTIKTTNKFTLITVANWAFYQSGVDETTSTTTNERQTNDKQTTTTKNDKKERSIYGMQKPSVDDVRAYCLSRNNTVDAQRFVDYYEANGWMVGRNKMKDWQAAVRNWEKRGQEEVIPKKYVN